MHLTMALLSRLGKRVPIQLVVSRPEKHSLVVYTTLNYMLWKARQEIAGLARH
jgi:hypothetical protein